MEDILRETAKNENIEALLSSFEYDENGLINFDKAID